MIEPNAPMNRRPIDDALDRLLCDFFAREMPRDLRTPPVGPELLDGRFRPIPRTDRRRAVAGFLAAGLVACGIAALLVANRPETRPIDAVSPVAGDGPVRRSVADEPAAARAVEAPRPPVVAVRPEDELDHGPLFVVEGIGSPRSTARVTPRGPVEAGSEWMNVRTIDEEAGTRPDYALPTGPTIEILPLDGPPVTPRLTPQAPDDPRLPESRSGDR